MSEKNKKVYLNEHGDEIRHFSKGLSEYLLQPFENLKTLLEMAMDNNGLVTLEEFAVLCIDYVKGLKERVERLTDEVDNKIGVINIVCATYGTVVEPGTILDYVLEPPAEKWRSPYIKEEASHD